MSIDIFSPRRPPVLGMDISGTAVRLVEVALVKGRLRLEGFAVQPLPDGVLVDGKVIDQDALTAAIGEALKSLRTRTRHAVVGLPQAVVVSKRISLPTSLRGEELDFAARNECAKIVGLPVSDLNVDYQVIGPAPGTVEENEVLLGAVQTTKVDEIVAMVEGAGVKPYIVDSSALAVQTVISLIAPPAQYPFSDVVYAHVGSQSTTLTVFRDGVPIHTKDQSFGADQLTADLMQRVGCDRETALAIQRGFGDEPEEYAEILAQFAETAGQEIVRGYRLIGASGHESQGVQFIVGGRVASMQAVIDAIEQHTGAQTRVADPFERMLVGPNVNVDLLALEAPSLLTALGLALRKFDDRPSLETLLESGAGDKRLASPEREVRPTLNLLPYRETRARENRRQIGVLSGGMVVLALGVGALVHGVFAGYIAQQEQRNAFITAENVKLDAQIGEINRLKSEIVALMERRKVIEALQADRAQTVQLMDQLVKLVPPGLHLKSVKQDGAAISVSGYAVSSDMVSAFMAAINGSQYLERPELVEIRAAVVGSRRLNEFNLNFSIRRPKSDEEAGASGKSDAAPSQSQVQKG